MGAGVYKSFNREQTARVSMVAALHFAGPRFYRDGRQLQSMELALQENWDFPVGTRRLPLCAHAIFFCFLVQRFLECLPEKSYTPTPDNPAQNPAKVPAGMLFRHSSDTLA